MILLKTQCGVLMFERKSFLYGRPCDNLYGYFLTDKLSMNKISSLIFAKTFEIDFVVRFGTGNKEKHCGQSSEIKVFEWRQSFVLFEVRSSRKFYV